MELLDRWDDLIDGSNYLEVALNDREAVCVKRCTSGMTYILQNNGKEVYSREFGADFEIRRVTAEEEKEILGFAAEQFAVEAEMDAKERGE